MHLVSVYQTAGTMPLLIVYKVTAGLNLPSEFSGFTSGTAPLYAVALQSAQVAFAAETSESLSLFSKYFPPTGDEQTWPWLSAACSVYGIGLLLELQHSRSKVKDEQRRIELRWIGQRRAEAPNGVRPALLVRQQRRAASAPSLLLYHVIDVEAWRNTARIELRDRGRRDRQNPRKSICACVLALGASTPCIGPAYAASQEYAVYHYCWYYPPIFSDCD
jgi:hypothetical protein